VASHWQNCYTKFQCVWFKHNNLDMENISHTQHIERNEASLEWAIIFSLFIWTEFRNISVNKQALKDSSQIKCDHTWMSICIKSENSPHYKFTIVRIFSTVK
jgi:hypothetical protein